jgi:hypothetical protein
MVTESDGGRSNTNGFAADVMLASGGCRPKIVFERALDCVLDGISSTAAQYNARA